MCWTSKTYNAKLDKLAELKAERTALDNAIKDLEEAIKADLGDIETLDTVKYLVRFTKYETTSFDKKAFGKVHPKLLEQFTKTTPARRFSFALKA